MIHCVVELFGMGRQLAGASNVRIELQEGATVRDLLAALGEKSPGLLGEVLTDDGRALVSAYSLSLNGRTFVDDLGLHPKDGDHFLIMLPAAGG